MKKKMITMTLAMTLCCLCVHAEDYLYLNIKNNDVSGTETSVSLSKFKKITFDGSNMIVTTTDGNSNFVLTGLDKMYFSSVATAIDAVETNADAQQVEIYTVNGLKVPSDNMTQGLYLIKENGNVKKVLKK